MYPRDIVVIGASAGGVDALRQLVAQLPLDFPASVFIVRHIGPTVESLLPEILERAGPLKASHALDGEPFVKSRIYVAPPDHHLMIEDGCVRLTRGPKENRTRPAVDALFRSAALALRKRVVGVILSGTLDDGTAGLWSVKYCGGVAVVQDPREAEFPGMPQSALDNVRVDHCVSLSEMGSLLIRLAADPVEDNSVDLPLAELDIENRVAFGGFENLYELNKLGELSDFSCPDCHGTLRRLSNSGVLRFRCRTGHAYTAMNLWAAQHEVTGNILSNAMRSLEERAALSEYLRQHAKRCPPDLDTFSVIVEKYRARLIQRLLTNNDAPLKTAGTTSYATQPNGGKRLKARPKRMAL